MLQQQQPFLMALWSTTEVGRRSVFRDSGNFCMCYFMRPNAPTPWLLEDTHSLTHSLSERPVPGKGGMMANLYTVVLVEKPTAAPGLFMGNPQRQSTLPKISLSFPSALWGSSLRRWSGSSWIRLLLDYQASSHHHHYHHLPRRRHDSGATLVNKIKRDLGREKPVLSR